MALDGSATASHDVKDPNDAMVVETGPRCSVVSGPVEWTLQELEAFQESRNRQKIRRNAVTSVGGLCVL